MAANRAGSVPSFTFVSTTGPVLDNASVKAMRAHTTKANFARRRMRLVRKYAAQKECAGRLEPLQTEADGRTADSSQALEIRLPVFSHPGLDRGLNGKDAFLINHLRQAMGKLYLVTNVPASSLAVMPPDWDRFLLDPTILDVSLYFARHVYAARLQHHAAQFMADAYKGKAIRSVRNHLSDGSNDVGDSLIAAILILTILDQVLDNIEGWKIHISGLVQIVALRSRNSNDLLTHWTSHAIIRTTVQGLLVFTRHDVTLLMTIEKTGIFDTMFSAPAKKSAYLILAVAEKVTAWQDTYMRNKQLRTSERLSLERMIESLDTAIQINSTASTRETFLTAIALSIKVFLQIVLHKCTTAMEGDLDNAAGQLVEVMQKPEQQTCSALALCSSLELLFWQTVMGAIAAPHARIKAVYMLRLERITIALALTTWHDADVILRRFFWIPPMFTAPGYQILSEILSSQGHTHI